MSVAIFLLVIIIAVLYDMDRNANIREVERREEEQRHRDREAFPWTPPSERDPLALQYERELKKYTHRRDAYVAQGMDHDTAGDKAADEVWGTN